MLKSCKYCGRIHDKKYVCDQKPIRRKAEATKISRFRSTKAWTDKSIEIRERDNYMCQICARNLYYTRRRFEYEGISVHHAIPVSEDWLRRLDNDNLITVCAAHHEMAENGYIPREEILDIIHEQEEKRIPPGNLFENSENSKTNVCPTR